MRKDLREPPPIGGYDKSITAIAILYRYAFAYLVSDLTTVNVA